MRYLFAFLIKHSFFFLFLFLEVVAFILIINYNRYQSSSFLNLTSEFTGSLHETAGNISDYFVLKKQNEELARENAQLKNQLNGSFIYSDTIFRYKDSLFRYTEAKVVNNSTRRSNNYLMLNKGSKHGIKTDMGVIDKGVAIGMVTGVSKNFCIVMPLIHKDAKISVIIKKNNQLANITWDEADYRYGLLEDIPMHISLEKGDTIISSGYSFIFPKGLLIGTVEEFSKAPGGSLNSARIQYFADFNKIDYLYIIENLKREELEQFEEIINNE